MAAGRIIPGVVLFHTLLTLVQAVNQGALSQSHASLRVKAKAADTADPRTVFSPPTMLIMSTPMERKVSYAQISNFRSVGGVVLPLLDAGLVGPYGIAWDGPRSALYVCDGALRKIFRVELEAFKCTSQCKGLEYQLRVKGNKFTVVEGVIAQWAAVDMHGNLFFTDQETNSVDKLSVESIQMIVREQLLPKDLGHTTEAEAEGEEAAVEAETAIVGENERTVVDANGEETVVEVEKSTATHVTTPQPPSIFQLYENKVSPHVGQPAGVATDGSRLYWTNQQGGFTSGSVVEGKTHPLIKQPAQGDSKPTFASTKIVNNTKSSYGITLTTDKILFTDSSHHVWATRRGEGNAPVALSSGLLKPRGIVWDGDNTAYVADQEGNFVVSLPVGLLKENAPITHTVDIHAPFGIALVKKTDPLWNPFLWSSAHRMASTGTLAMIMASVGLAITLG
jgi:sugar lactone lactonase YvrE